MGIEDDAIFCTISEGKAGGPATMGGHTVIRESQQLQRGRQLNTGYVRGLVKRLKTKAGIKRNVSPHSLRHTFCTRLLRATGDMHRVQKAMRHSKISTTIDIYSHLVQQDVDDAIAALPGSEEYQQQAEQANAVTVLQALPDETKAALVKLLTAAAGAE